MTVGARTNEVCPSCCSCTRSEFEVRTPSAYVRLVAELGDDLAQSWSTR